MGQTHGTRNTSASAVKKGTSRCLGSLLLGEEQSCSGACAVSGAWCGGGSRAVPELDHLPVDTAFMQVAAIPLQPGTVTADTAAGEMDCSLSALAAVLLAHPLLFNRSFSTAPVALPFPTQRNCMIPAGIRTGS